MLWAACFRRRTTIQTMIPRQSQVNTRNRLMPWSSISWSKDRVTRSRYLTGCSITSSQKNSKSLAVRKQIIRSIFHACYSKRTTENPSCWRGGIAPSKNAPLTPSACGKANRTRKALSIVPIRRQLSPLCSAVEPGSEKEPVLPASQVARSLFHAVLRGGL